MSARTEARKEARRRNLTWADVQAVYEELKAEAYEIRERPNEIRRVAWTMYTSAGCHSFWRHGFVARFGDRMARGADLTSIPFYDELAQQVSWEFPEYADDAGTERLWDFLLSPYDKLPSAASLYAEALDRVECGSTVDDRHAPADCQF